MKLYADPITINCRKVIAALDLVQLDYDLVHVDYMSGAHKSEKFRTINPNAELPVLVDGSLVLSESNAVLQYIAEVKEACSYYPKDKKVRADIHRWQFWEATKWYPSCYVFLVENVVKPLQNEEPDQAVLTAAEANWHRLAGIIDQRLIGQRWLCGNSVTIADISVAAPMHLHRWQRLPLERHPNLLRWMTECIETLPCWKTSDPTKQLGFVALESEARC